MRMINSVTRKITNGNNMKTAKLILFFIFLSKSLLSQTNELCANRFLPTNKKKATEYFEEFYKEQSAIRSKRENLLSKINSINRVTSNDIITIKRRIVKSPIGSNTLISNNDWNTVLQRTNIAFAPIAIEFMYDPVIDTIYNNNYYDFEPNIDDGLFTYSNTPNNLHHINLYIVNCVKVNNLCYSGASSAPPYDNSLDAQQDVSVPGNSILVTTWGVIDYSATFVHELGHFFGLLHTFENSYGGQEKIDGSNSNTAGDFIIDTKANHLDIARLNDTVCPAQSCPCVTKKQDCNGQYYNPDLSNYMSYFQNSCLHTFTPMQYDIMFKVKNEFRGYLYKPLWVQASVINSLYNNSNFCSLNTVKFKVSKIKGAQSVLWSFPGGSANSLTSNQVEVTYPSYGNYNYSITVSNGIDQPYSTESKSITISDPNLNLRPLPITEGFESGIPSLNSGWEFPDSLKDCSYFNLSNSIGSNNTHKSLFKSSFLHSINQGDNIPDNNIKDDVDDFFTLPFSLQNLSSCILSFDYAYQSKTAKGDTLTIYYLDCNEWKQLWRKGGDDLETIATLMHNHNNLTQFIPTQNDWLPTIIDASSIINTNNTKATRFAFSLKTEEGNRFYIDNIRISGQPISATTSATALFSRTDHKIHLNWPDLSTDETGYSIERSYSEDGPWSTITTLPVNATSYNDLSNLPNTVYWYRIKVEGTTLSIPYSNIINDTSCNIPNRPIPLTVSAPGNRTVHLSWPDNNSNETNYVVFYSLSKNGFFDTLAILPPGTTSYTHNPTPGNTFIYYVVKAIEVNFYSRFSDTVVVNYSIIPTKTLSRLEYFVDNDPGFFNGNYIDISGSFSYTNLPVNIPLGSIPSGIHNLYLRASDNTVKWSNIFSHSFIRVNGSASQPKIEIIETYIDNDPGVGQGQQTNVSNISGNEFNVPVDLSTIPTGIHTLLIRAKDKIGTWSNIYSKNFVRLPGTAGNPIITKLEYCIDNLTSFGNGINVPITNVTKLDQPFTVNLDNVTSGLHTIYFRSKDNKETWSNLYSRSFVCFNGLGGSKAIRQLEYYFDTDPGFGNGIVFNNAINSAQLISDFTAPLNTLSDGFHFIYIRAKDQNGNWSNIFGKSFLKLTAVDGTRKIIELQYSVDNGLLIGTGTAIALTAGNNVDVSFSLPPLSNGKHTLSIKAKDNAGLLSNIYLDSFYVNDQSFCQLGAIIYFRSTVNNATSYQWQEDNGLGWVSISETNIFSGTQTQTLKLTNPPTNLYGKKYRCIVSTIPDQTFILKFTNTWTGAIDNDWFNVKNWSCNALPDEFVDVVIEAGVNRFPFVNANAVCHSLHLKNGASVTLQAGQILNITGK